jgi:hypothetical protein
MKKTTNSNPLKYFNDEKAKKVAKLTKAQDGMNYTRKYVSNVFDNDQSFLNSTKEAPKKFNIVKNIKEKINEYKEDKANRDAYKNRPRFTATSVLVPIPESYTNTKAVSDTSSTKKVNTTPTKKVEPKGPKGVIPGTSTSKSTYTDKDNKPVYTDTSRPNEYFTMTKTKAGQDSLAPYNSQMGLYGEVRKKSGGQTKSKKKK